MKPKSTEDDLKLPRELQHLDKIKKKKSVEGKTAHHERKNLKQTHQCHERIWIEDKYTHSRKQQSTTKTPQTGAPGWHIRSSL